MKFDFFHKIWTPMAKKPRTDGNNSRMIVAKIVSEFKDRTRKDIAKWRSALSESDDIETPRRVLLHDLYDDLSTDGHLQSQILIRKLATLSSTFIITDKKTGKINQEKTDLLKTEWFFDFVDFILDSIYRGYTVLELTDTVNTVFEPIPYRNIVPERTLVLYEVYGDEGINFSLPIYNDYLVIVGKKRIKAYLTTSYRN